MPAHAGNGCKWYQISCQWNDLWVKAARDSGELYGKSLYRWTAMPITDVLDNLSVPNNNDTYDALSASVNVKGTTIRVGTIIGYMKWFIGCAAILMIVIYFAKLAWSNRQGSGNEGQKALFYISFGLVLSFGAINIISALLPATLGSGNMANWIMNQLWSITILSLICGTVATAIKVIVEQNGKPIKELFESFILVVLVVNLGGAIVALCSSISDKLAMKIMASSMDCGNYASNWGPGNFYYDYLVKIHPNLVPAIPTGDISSQISEACFSDKFGTAFSESLGTLGWFLIAIFCLVATILILFQSMIFIGRQIIIVPVLGVMAFSASLRHTKVGKEGLEKSISWIFALLMYKPLAMIVYSIQFRMLNSSHFINGGFWGFMHIIAATVVSVVAVPTVIKLMLPSSESLSTTSGQGAMGSVMQGVYGINAMRSMFSSSGKKGGGAHPPGK
jgi:hypothetical protein